MQSATEYKSHGIVFTVTLTSNIEHIAAYTKKKDTNEQIWAPWMLLFFLKVQYVKTGHLLNSYSKQIGGEIMSLELPPTAAYCCGN